MSGSSVRGGRTAPLALPIDSWIPRILESLESGRALVLKASPGAGKTTRVPAALLDAAWRKEAEEIWVLEPRRLAAKLSAERVAWERGGSVGQEVGYQFRFENRTSTQSRLIYLTEGMLLRRLLSNPTLRGVSAVVLDEFHERHLQTDLALTLLRRLQQRERPDLRLIVMSATLETDSLQKFLGEGVPVIEVEAPRFPVETVYWPEEISHRQLPLAVVQAVRKGSAQHSDGDFLVFLPGMAEILRTQAAMEESFSRGEFEVLPLHGELAREDQDRAVSPRSAGPRRVILATNIAETSLTIPGVRIVIDSGLARIASVEGGTGIPALRTRPISRASGVQRAGRAGRTGAGLCIRLYTRGAWDGRPAFEIPEIRRLDLTSTLLELTALGVTDPWSLEWFDPPEKSALDAGVDLLELLGALERRAARELRLTSAGRVFVQWPLHPRIARLLQTGQNPQDRSPWLIRLAVLLSEDGLEEGELFESLAPFGSIPLGRLEGAWGRQENRLLETARRVWGGGSENQRVRAEAEWSAGSRLPALTEETRRTLRRAVLAAFPDRILRRLPNRGSQTGGREGRIELQWMSGGSVQASETWCEANQTFWVALSLDLRQTTSGSRGERRLRVGAAIEPDWLLDLPGNFLREEESFEWIREAERLEGKSRLLFGQLVLSESRLLPGDRPKAAAEKVLSVLRIQKWMGLQEVSVAWWVWLRRLEFLRRSQVALSAGEMEKLKPVLSPNDLEEALIPGLVEGMVEWGLFTFSDLRRFETSAAKGLVALGQQALGEEATSLLDRMLPLEWRLPHGRKLQIQYSAEQSPWVESRLQDFFGAAQGPALLGGRVPLTLHLLAPNGRPVQVTQDLSSFWAKAYPELRTALSRRYPRHSWPENPLVALPPEPRRR